MTKLDELISRLDTCAICLEQINENPTFPGNGYRAQNVRKIIIKVSEELRRWREAARGKELGK